MNRDFSDFFFEYFCHIAHPLYIYPVYMYVCVCVCIHTQILIEMLGRLD